MRCESFSPLSPRGRGAGGEEAVLVNYAAGDSTWMVRLAICSRVLAA